MSIYGKIQNHSRYNKSVFFKRSKDKFYRVYKIKNCGYDQIAYTRQNICITQYGLIILNHILLFINTCKGWKPM